MEVVVEDQGIPPEAVRKAIEVQVWRNQFSPRFSKTEYNVDVPEMTQYATTVLTVTATDLDQDRQQDVRFNTYNDEIFLYKPWNRKGFFQFEITINGLVSSFWFIWIPMLWVYGHYK